MPQMQIGSLSLQLNSKAIKNLHISVLPPDGRIRMSAPEQMTDTAIRMAVVSRIPWIKKQQRDFAAQPRQSDREMVSGECHYFWGKRHRLNLIERVGRHEVKVSGGKIHLFVNPGTSIENRALVLSECNYSPPLKTSKKILDRFFDAKNRNWTDKPKDGDWDIRGLLAPMPRPLAVLCQKNRFARSLGHLRRPKNPMI